MPPPAWKNANAVKIGYVMLYYGLKHLGLASNYQQYSESQSDE